MPKMKSKMGMKKEMPDEKMAIAVSKKEMKAEKEMEKMMRKMMK